MRLITTFIRCAGALVLTSCMSVARDAGTNSIAMLGGAGPYGAIDMGGMFTIVKVRDDMDYGRDPGRYKQPPGTSAWRVDSLSTAPAQQPPSHEGHGK